MSLTIFLLACSLTITSLTICRSYLYAAIISLTICYFFFAMAPKAPRLARITREHSRSRDRSRSRSPREYPPVTPLQVPSRSPEPAEPAPPTPDWMFELSRISVLVSALELYIPRLQFTLSDLRQELQHLREAREAQNVLLRLGR